MVENTNGRGGLKEAPFSFHAGGDNKVFISWRGSQVLVLNGESALSFLNKVNALDSAGQQILMAKVTGNFKRGNER